MDKHANAKALYRDYVERAALRVKREAHTRMVISATEGSGMTPVQPLATFGRNGGPLLCDLCGKPMILEGKGYQGVPADEAWRRNPIIGWQSYISGGMVLLAESNGTLRVYHGYTERPGCAMTADQIDQKARENHRARTQEDTSEKLVLLMAYFRDELPENANDGVLGRIAREIFAYDPGPGINTPE